MLYIVATPIGNLADISFRAIDVLRSVDLIACEDTRHTKILLDHYGIKTPTTSFFQHSRVTKLDYLLRLLKEDKSIALVSDAGMPGILDPGYTIINQAIAEGIVVSVIPGPVAFINALVSSGKPAHKFYFTGFLPNRPQARRNRLVELQKFDCTVVFYESCHRIAETLSDVAKVYGEKEVIVTRELTKKFEEIKRGKAEELSGYYKEKKARGEFVVVL